MRAPQLLVLTLLGACTRSGAGLTGAANSAAVALRRNAPEARSPGDVEIDSLEQVKKTLSKDVLEIEELLRGLERAAAGPTPMPKLEGAAPTTSACHEDDAACELLHDKTKLGAACGVFVLVLVFCVYCLCCRHDGAKIIEHALHEEALDELHEVWVMSPRRRAG
mmetsp:Transcript_55940/g.155988  ORF Transcript_55940/g.155988 Transcript_55940/m.155988 type:complete len:165 (-) Transcript_55940:128-622(-)